MNKTIELLKKSDALLTGHFLLSSGKHSDRYIQCAKLIRYPEYCSQVAEIIAEKLRQTNLNVDVCVGPAMGGIIIAYELARKLNTPAIFTERVNGKMQLRRGFEVKNGDNVLIVEDVITTGKSSLETCETLKKMGANIVGLSCIVNRSAKAQIDDLPVISACELQINVWDKDQLPEELKKIPVVKPGSRSILDK